VTTSTNPNVLEPLEKYDGPVTTHAAAVHLAIIQTVFTHITMNFKWKLRWATSLF